eukprot:364590-Chlamydomonas_euryale.AAC.2
MGLMQLACHTGAHAAGTPAVDALAGTCVQVACVGYEWGMNGTPFRICASIGFGFHTCGLCESDGFVQPCVDVLTLETAPACIPPPVMSISVHPSIHPPIRPSVR